MRIIMESEYRWGDIPTVLSLSLLETIERSKMMKFVFLFGAEMGYGLPSGGRFALDIFRHDPTKSKNESGFTSNKQSWVARLSDE